MQRGTGRTVLAGTLALLAAAVVGCAAVGTTEHQALPGQTVGLAAIADSGPTSAGSIPTSAAPAVRVTVPDLTNAGTIANLTAPAVTVPAESTGPAEPTPAAPAPAEPAPAAEAPAPAPPAPDPPAPPPTPPLAPVVPPYGTVLGWTGEGSVAYLTFDDGPGPATGQVLDILAAKGVQATFCVLGQRVVENPEMIRRIVAAGHTVCNHSWDHPTGFAGLSVDAMTMQIGATQDAILAATGHRARYFRAPEGSFGDAGGLVHQVAQQARTIPLGWAVDSKDWTKPGAATIVSNVVGAVTPGAIILAHDAGGTDRQQTLEALPGIIDGLRNAGYTLLPLPPEPAG